MALGLKRRGRPDAVMGFVAREQDAASRSTTRSEPRALARVDGLAAEVAAFRRAG